jgi:hypothetical protein
MTPVELWRLPSRCLQCLRRCHCTDCRKISGGIFRTNYIVPSENFKILFGMPKEIEKTADMGKSVTRHNALPIWRLVRRQGRDEGHPRCGDNCVRSVDILTTATAGILDDVNVINRIKPTAELFAPERVTWIAVPSE